MRYFTVFFNFYIAYIFLINGANCDPIQDKEHGKKTICYPVACHPDSARFLLFQKLVNKEEFELAIFSYGSEFSLSVIKKIDNEYYCYYKTIQLTKVVDRNGQFQRELLHSVNTVVLGEKIDSETVSVLLKTLKKQVVLAAYPESNVKTDLKMDGTAYDVYVRGETSDPLSMYAANFLNPENASDSCGNIHLALHMYVSDKKKYSASLKAIVNYLIDVNAGKKMLEDPVKKKMNENFKVDTSKIPPIDN